MSNAIPGYEEAVAKERAARNGVYLGTPYSLCGFKVRNITPRILATLTEARTPFIFGGKIESEAPFIQFILACQDAESRNMDATTEAAVLADLDEWEREIDEFVALTFLDSQGGDSDDAPIASAIANYEYRMSREPFRWDYETKTADTPIRRINQLIRCDDRYNGGAVMNPLSSKIEGDWLDGVNEALRADPDGTRKILAEIQDRAACRRAGIPYVPTMDLIPTTEVSA